MTISDIDQKLIQMRIDYKTASPAMKQYLVNQAKLLKEVKEGLIKTELIHKDIVDKQ